MTECNCQKETHNPQLIVITGGPGAGKTALLELSRKHFCEHIAVLPEAASILFGGGFWRRQTESGKKSAQRAIFHVQKELEQIVLDEKKSAAGLCDRGTIDGLAYWPGEEAEFWRELGSSREQEYAKYSAVILLRTPDSKSYNHQNPLRIESPELAAEIDRRIFEVWKDHPHVHVVESEVDFISKVATALSLIRLHLPDCCKHHKTKT